MDGVMDEVDDELADLSKRVRAAQRRNMLVKLASAVIVIVGIIIGIVLHTTYPVGWRGAPWLGFIGGIVLGGTILKKFEVQVEEIE